MGLDLVVEGAPKPGHEEEWREILGRSFADNPLASEDVAKFQDIIIPAHANLGAPRVGFDEEANQWILEVREAKTEDEIKKCLEEFHGYYVVHLVDVPGVPRYTHGDMYEGVDRTSFRGGFLKDCETLLGADVLDDAWNHKWPEDAVAYGAKLLGIADEAEKGIRKAGASDEVSLEEQVAVLRAAGAWYQFWGEKGHAIRAWF